MLTLMKGDEGVEGGKGAGNFCLFRPVWYFRLNLNQVTRCQSGLGRLARILAQIKGVEQVVEKGRIIKRVGLHSYGMFGEICLSICDIDVPAQRSLSTNQRV